MAGRKVTDSRLVVEFRGGEFEVDKRALESFKVQKAMACAGKDAAKAFWAIDMICCGRSDEYMSRIPDEDGNVSELGCTDEDFAAFMSAVSEAASKN